METPEKQNDPTMILPSLSTETAATETFLDRARTMIGLGVPIVPLPPRKKSPPPRGWTELATTDVHEIYAWVEPNEKVPIVSVDSNCGCVAKPDGVWFLDIDNLAMVSEQIKEETGHNLYEIQTLIVESSNGKQHFYFKQNAASRSIGNFDYDDSHGGELFSTRVNNRYVVSPLSIHPITSQPYKIIRNATIIEAPEWLTNWLMVVKKPSTARKEKTATPDTKATVGARGGRCQLRKAA
jgi:Bifunctional DNA primase/polymerase, N-terminal